MVDFSRSTTEGPIEAVAEEYFKQTTLRYGHPVYRPNGEELEVPTYGLIAKLCLDKAVFEQPDSQPHTSESLSIHNKLERQRAVSIELTTTNVRRAFEVYSKLIGDKTRVQIAYESLPQPTQVFQRAIIYVGLKGNVLAADRLEEAAEACILGHIHFQSITQSGGESKFTLHRTGSVYRITSAATLIGTRQEIQKYLRAIDQALISRIHSTGTGE